MFRLYHSLGQTPEPLSSVKLHLTAYNTPLETNPLGSIFNCFWSKAVIIMMQRNCGLNIASFIGAGHRYYVYSTNLSVLFVQPFLLLSKPSLIRFMVCADSRIWSALYYRVSGQEQTSFDPMECIFTQNVLSRERICFRKPLALVGLITRCVSDPIKMSVWQPSVQGPIKRPMVWYDPIHNPSYTYGVSPWWVNTARPWHVTLFDVK